MLCAYFTVSQFCLGLFYNFLTRRRPLTLLHSQGWAAASHWLGFISPNPASCIPRIYCRLYNAVVPHTRSYAAGGTVTPGGSRPAVASFSCDDLSAAFVPGPPNVLTSRRLV